MMKATHYQDIARMIRTCKEGATKIELERLERLSYMFADDFAAKNPKFQRETFFTQAGF